MYVGRTGGDGIDYLHPPGSTKDPVGNEIGPYWHHDRIEGDSGWTISRQEGGPGEDQPQLGFEIWKGGWKQYKDWLIENNQDSFAYFAGNHDDFQSAPEGEHMFSHLGENFHMANYFTSEANDFIGNTPSQQPWGAVLSFFGPHLPVAPPKPWDTLFSLEEIQLPSNFEDDLGEKPIRQKEISESYYQEDWRVDQYKDYIRRYWGYCGYIDAQIGRIFQTLKNTGQWENTLIVFTSDHGDMLTGHGMIFKLAANGYEELFKVPAIIKLPNESSAGKSYLDLVSSIDLLPTILDATEIESPDSLDGKSLLPLLSEKDKKWREYIFSEVHVPGNEGKTIICRDSRFKYVYHWLSDDVDELYDLTTDPGELRNLYTDEKYTDRIKLMRQIIINWAVETDHRYAKIIALKAEK